MVLSIYKQVTVLLSKSARFLCLRHIIVPTVALGVERKNQRMGIIATHVIAILDMIDVLNTYYQRESVVVDDVAKSLSMSLIELIHYLDLLVSQGKVEWHDDGNQRKIKLSVDGYLVLSMQDTRRKRQAVM